MAGLTVKGDPYAWLDAGRAISTLMMQLESELPYAGGPVIRAWHGPTASAFTADWTSRRSRYEDLISHARTAAKAITAYGEKLHDLVQQAVNLESYWCGLGLHVMETGAGFMLPPGFDLLTAGRQLSLHQALAESRTAVEKMASDAVGAVEDLTVAIGAAIVALEDFELIAVGAVAGYVAKEFREPLGKLRQDLEFASDAAGFVRERAVDAAKDAKKLATLTSAELRARQSSAGRLLPTVGRDARAAAAKASWLEGLDVGIAGLATGVVAMQVIGDARHEGYRVSFEQHSGAIASTLTTDIFVGVAVFTGVGPGVVAAGIIAVGVGFTVQEVVDHRKAIGHFAERVVADL